MYRECEYLTCASAFYMKTKRKNGGNRDAGHDDSEEISKGAGSKRCFKKRNPAGERTRFGAILSLKLCLTYRL